MGPALTTGWCRVINGLHREINCSAAISSTRKTQPLRFEVFYERVVTVINMCFLLLVSISCICGFVQPESKREWLWVGGGGNETAVCCGSNVLLTSTRSILLACVLRLPFILFSVIRRIFQFYGPLFQWAAYKISKHIWFYLDTTGTHTVFRQQLCSDSI